MATPQSPDTRPTDLETPGDKENSAADPTNADILREQAISDAQARDDLQAKQDMSEDRLAEDTSSDLKQGAAIEFPGER